ncbi:MAG: urea transporter [Verrucomicrobia bacterium]|nr:urea transporter [Verrucomicrobiota bacterium]
MSAHLKAIFNSYAEIFFLHGAPLGAAIFVVTLANPGVALAGIIAVVAAYGFARLVKMDQQFLASGYYTYNPLLVGLSLGFLFKLSALTVFFVVSAGVLTFLVTVFMANVFQTYLRLPILSLPFVVVSSIAYLASLRYTNLLVRVQHDTPLLTTDLGLPFWLAGFFKAFGAILFAPSVVVGLLLCVAVLCYSRILFLLAALGYYTGAMIRDAMFGSTSHAFADLSNFNFILIAMAVGGVFLVPSLTSYLLAVIAVAVSTLFADAMAGFWSLYGIPAFTLPFNIVTLGLVYVLSLLRHPMVATSVGRTPEETLEMFLANRLRYRGQDRTLYLPFAGRWTVWQAFDGQWTHKGSWRYAYDFVITDERGETHRGDGSKLEDYYCYNKPVLSPVRGRVAHIVDDLPDSPVGGADETNRWGNLVIIHDERGFYVELSHLAEKSIRVKKGDWVERGTVLGLCGNSGYSPQPHIHVQAQAADTVGDATLPFSFVSYSDGDEYQANNVPAEKRVVEPLYRDKRLDNATNFVLDDELCYAVRRDGKPAGELKLKVKMAPDATFYFESARGQLYFGKHENTFYFYRVAGNDPWLRQLFLALPRMPLACRDGLTWHDYVPVGLVASGLREAVVGVLSSVWPKLATVKVTLRFASDNRVESVIEAGPLRVRKTASVDLDRGKGFARISVNGLVFERVSQPISPSP